MTNPSCYDSVTLSIWRPVVYLKNHDLRGDVSHRGRTYMAEWTCGFGEDPPSGFAVPCESAGEYT